MITKDFSGFMDFGIGLDSVSGNVRGLATTRPAPQTVPTADGQRVIFGVHQTESVEDLHKVLGLAVDMEASFGMFGGSEKFTFAEESNFHSYSLFFVVSIEVHNEETHMIGEELVPAAAQLLAAGQAERFRQEFGDVYLKGIQTGGQYYAVVEVLTTDETDRTNLSNSFSAGGLFGGVAGSVDTSFDAKFEQATARRQLNISTLQAGGLSEGASQKVSPQDMVAKATAFPSEVAGHPVPYRAEFQDFQALNVPPPPNLVQIQNAKDVLAQYASRRSALLQLGSDIAYIQQHPDQFESFDSGRLNQIAAQVAEALNTITAAASQCMNDLTTCRFVVPAMPDVSQLPQRRAGAPVQVPDLRGQLFKDVAANQLFAPGGPLKLTSHPHPAALEEPGRILDVTPAPGSTVPAGSTVDCGVATLAPIQVIHHS